MIRLVSPAWILLSIGRQERGPVIGRRLDNMFYVFVGIPGLELNCCPKRKIKIVYESSYVSGGQIVIQPCWCSRDGDYGIEGNK